MAEEKVTHKVQIKQGDNLIGTFESEEAHKAEFVFRAMCNAWRFSQPDIAITLSDSNGSISEFKPIRTI